MNKSELNDNQTLCHKLGVLRALGLIFKHGKREELLPYSEDILDKIIKLKILTCADSPLRKLSVKLIQRIGEFFYSNMVNFCLDCGNCHSL